MEQTFRDGVERKRTLSLSLSLCGSRGSDAKSISTFRGMPMRLAIFLARDGAVVTSYWACASAPVKGSRRWNPAVGQKSPRLPQGSTASLPAEKRGKSADRNSPVGNVTRSLRNGRRGSVATRLELARAAQRPGSAINSRYFVRYDGREFDLRASACRRRGRIDGSRAAGLWQAAVWADERYLHAKLFAHEERQRRR